MGMDIQKAADALYEAENGAYQISMISQDNPDMTIDDAYAIQLKNIDRRLADGEKLVGMKIGLTSKAMQQLLGVDVPDDTHGCLQDIHWAMGDMGYFPSYALGSAYSAQAVDDLRKTMDLDAQWAEGNMQPLKDALRSRVWQHGRAKEPQWLVQSLCGGAFDAAHYTNYLKNKYTELYGL